MASQESIEEINAMIVSMVDHSVPGQILPFLRKCGNKLWYVGRLSNASLVLETIAIAFDLATYPSEWAVAVINAKVPIAGTAAKSSAGHRARSLTRPVL